MINQSLFTSKTPEHYTPKEIVEKIKHYWGYIYLDPCSDRGFNIPAYKHYTKEDNGLSQPWEQTVYVNPPYGRNLKDWVNKAILEKSNCDEILMLLPSRTDTKWFHLLMEYASALCFIKGRLKFIGNDNPAPFPSVLVTLGSNPLIFKKYWQDTGLVLTTYDYMC